MRNINEYQYLGLSKSMFNSSVCLLEGREVEIVQSERITRKKASGAWPEHALNYLIKKIDKDRLQIAENRDVTSPQEFENIINSKLPFFNYLKQRNLDQYTKYFNKNIKYLTHHLCHAYSTLPLSPFQESIILVLDGAGSALNDFGLADYADPIDSNLKGILHEECSAYHQQGAHISCIEKRWQEFLPSQHHNHDFSEGVGMFYEKIAEYIFNNKRSAGKVMGLAPFGTSRGSLHNIRNFLNSLDWQKAFNRTAKSEWESSPNLALYQNLAATVQDCFENNVHETLLSIKKRFPKVDNLILTGGTALNCTNNFKILQSKLFNNIYVPPFPSDECISYGLANFLYYKDGENIKSWSPKPASKQHGYFGPISSIPNEEMITSIFKNFTVSKPNNLEEEVATLLNSNNIIAWFQGRSESGPRALGNRSILASPSFPDLKNYLNQHIKFRENFRPYGCSIPREYSHIYFHTPRDFDNPYMSFATQIRDEHLVALKEVSHVDNTSRMQTVSIDQNERFYKLLQSFGNQSGLYCLLNTSLNIMGEPIVETIDDLKKFFDQSKISYVVVDDFIISKN